MLTTQFVFSWRGSLISIERRGQRHCDGQTGVRQHAQLFGATEGIPDDGHDRRLVLFVEQYNAGGSCGDDCRGGECHCGQSMLGKICLSGMTSSGRRLMIEDGMKWKEIKVTQVSLRLGLLRKGNSNHDVDHAMHESLIGRISTVGRSLRPNAFALPAPRTRCRPSAFPTTTKD